jgi:chorismate synthase
LTLLAWLFSPALLIHAQVAQVIDGRITDPAGALVSKARVTITRASTGVVARSIESNPSGIYTAPGLTVGAYNVRVEAPGFKTFEQNNVMVDVNSTVQVDVQLSVGNETQDVIVQANPVSVQAADQRSEHLDQRAADR